MVIIYGWIVYGYFEIHLVSLCLVLKCTSLLWLRWYPDCLWFRNSFLAVKWQGVWTRGWVTVQC